MHRTTKFLADARLSSRSLLLKPRDFASETHRSKLSLIDCLASARDAFAASVPFFCANATLDVTALTMSAAATTKRMDRMAVLLSGLLFHVSLVSRILRVPLYGRILGLSKRRTKMHLGLEETYHPVRCAHSQCLTGSGPVAQRIWQARTFIASGESGQPRVGG